ncbi:MAG: c-type cytochrome, partial [Candidatus Saccharimonas sp.]|nr:c-type cytochrome [Planctomycetaceae bacterium]
PQQKEEANIILFADEKEPIDLRTLGRVGNYTVAEHWKALPHNDEQEQLFALLMERLDDTDDKVRLQAAHFLSLLNDPRSEPKIALVTTNVQDKRLNLGKLEHLKPEVWMLGPVPDAEGFKTVHPVETAAIDLAAKYEVAGKSFEWKLTKPSSPDRPLYDFHTMFGPSPNSSVYSFFRFDVPTAQRMQLLVGSEDGVKVWHNGRLVFENDVVRPLIQLDDVVPLDLQPGSNDVLVRVRMRQGLGGQYLHYRHLGDVRLSIPDKPDGLSLAERLKTGTAWQHIDPKFLEVDWPEAVKKGDVARGKKLFAAESLGCAKCHAATATQAGGGGPSLTDSGKRFTVPYLVESVLAPNKVISPVFKSSIIATTDGKIITGLVVSETGDKLEVLLPDTKRVTINKSDIDERKLGDVSAMPPGVVKTVDELRDVLAYLLSNPAPE